MRENGFNVRTTDVNDLTEIKKSRGVPDQCAVMPHVRRQRLRRRGTRAGSRRAPHLEGKAGNCRNRRRWMPVGSPVWNPPA